MTHPISVPEHHRRAGQPLHTTLTRRSWLGGGAAMLSGAARTAAAVTATRLGILQFGTVQWVAQVIRDHALDGAHGFALQTSTLANTDAGRVGLMANAVDIVMSDWIFAASQRAAGTKLCFAPFSSSLGGLMVRPGSPIGSLADLAKRRLGVAGGPIDKSWLIVRAATKATAGYDPADAADVVYGAPPLLNAKLMQGELDAVLTYWNFAARLEAAGCRQVTAVGDCARDLGISGSVCLLGFVFHEDWAKRNPDAINGFLAATAAAEELLSGSEAIWQAIRPVMNAPEDALFATFRRRFLEGVTHPSAEVLQQDAQRLFDVLLRTGGPRGTDGLEQLPAGIFWPTQHG